MAQISCKISDILEDKIENYVQEKRKEEIEYNKSDTIREALIYYFKNK